MKDLNNFANLTMVQGRDFENLKSKLMQIGVPAKVEHWGMRTTGQPFAIVRTDRPVKKVKGKVNNVIDSE